MLTPLGPSPLTPLGESRKAASAALLLDTYPGAAAYSVRKLRTGYSGAAMKVRHDTNNAEADVAFDGTGIVSLTAVVTLTAIGSSGYSIGQTMSLSAFAAGGDVRGVTWYDQSGNGRDMAQSSTSAQPLLISAGTLQTLGGKAAFVFDGSDDHFEATYSITITALMLLMVMRHEVAGGNYGRIYSQSDAGDDFNTSDHYIPVAFNNFMRDDLYSFVNGDFRAGVYAPSGTHELVTSLHSGAGITNRVNGVTSASYSDGINKQFTRHRIFRGVNSFSECPAGRVQECITWAADKTADRAGIEADAQTYYGL
jgi:hypothetical protein